jgi:hypothetical protein
MTPTAQLAPAARLLPLQLSCVRLNGAAMVSVNEVAAKLPVLVTVTVCAALDWLVSVAAKVNCDGLALSTVVADPLPLSGTNTGVTPRVEEEIVNVAALLAAVAGVKITCTVQLLPLFKVVPQVEALQAKLLAAAPVI